MGSRGIPLPGFDSNRSHLFALGRNAMYAACEAVGLKAGDEVVTPAFDCDGSLQPFTAKGCTLRFYRSDPASLTADLNDLRRCISSRTRLIHIVQHFGLPQPWNELGELRRESGIPILEDNAYSLFSSYQGRPFGSFGDLAVFSLRKELPLTDGGWLRINNPEYSYSRDTSINSAPWFYRSELESTLYLLQGIVRRKFRVPLPLVRIARVLKFLSPNVDGTYLPPLYSDPLEDIPNVPYRDVAGSEFVNNLQRPMSRLARLQLSRYGMVDFCSIREQRRSSYATLVNSIQDIPGKVILYPELPEGAVPFCLNFRIENCRDEILGELARNYSVMAWPTLPGLVLSQLDKFPDVQILGRELMQFSFPKGHQWPQDYPNHLKQFANDFRQVMKRFNS